MRDTDDPRPPADDIAAVSALDEPARRRIYEYVHAQDRPVSRDEVSEGLRMARQTAAFHLDKLAGVGLLEVGFARRSGRSGPGAGRPAKLYSRAPREFTVQLPERSYELAGQLLAQAVDDTDTTGRPPRENLSRRAREMGQSIGATMGPGDADLLSTLERCGYEPRIDGDDITLANCPFHALVRDHTDMVCGMNLDLIGGMLNAAGCTDKQARLVPHACSCCVRIGPAAQETEPPEAEQSQ